MTHLSFPGSDLEPEWLESVQRNGELFYLELSEGEEETLLNSQGVNHVRFCENEAEVISEDVKKDKKTEPRFKRLAKILKNKHIGKKRSARLNSQAGPTSILKHQPSHKTGMSLHQQYKDVCLYVNPNRLLENGPYEKLNLLQALIGIVHQSSRTSKLMERQGKFDAVHKLTIHEKLVIHGFIPESPAVRSHQICIGKCHLFQQISLLSSKRLKSLLILSTVFADV